MLTFGVKKIVTVCSGKAFRCTSPRVLCVARCSGDPLSVEGLYCFVVQIFKNLKANASHEFVGRVCSVIDASLGLPPHSLSLPLRKSGTFPLTFFSALSRLSSTPFVPLSSYNEQSARLQGGGGSFADPDGKLCQRRPPLAATVRALMHCTALQLARRRLRARRSAYEAGAAGMLWFDFCMRAHVSLSIRSRRRDIRLAVAAYATGRRRDAAAAPPPHLRRGLQRRRHLGVRHGQHMECRWFC